MLDRVGGLFLLPNTELATVNQVARFYEVSRDTIQKVFKRNRVELELNGVKVLTSREIAQEAFHKYKLSSQEMMEYGINNRATTIFTLRTILLVGFMLRDSKFADKVRKLAVSYNDDVDVDELFDDVEAHIVEAPTVEAHAVEPIIEPIIKPTIENIVEDIVEQSIEQAIQKEQYNMQVVKHDEQLVIDSRDVAVMVSKEHRSVIRDIRNVIEHLGGQNKIVQSYFIESTYTNSQNKQQPCYLLTKKGCELFSTRMTGAKGTQFAVAYIEKFNLMEEQLKAQAVVPVASYMIENPIERAKMCITKDLN